jgi:hypothetical protein
MYTARHCGTYLYLIHVQDNVYKVGYSTDLYKRVHNYPKPYKVVLSIDVGAKENGRQAERVVLDCFKQQFKHRTDLGTEYFEGSKTDMVSHITSVASRFCGGDDEVLPSTVLQKKDAMHVVLDFAGPIIGDRVTIPIADFYGELQRVCTEKGFITPNMKDVSRYVKTLFHARVLKTNFVFQNEDVQTQTFEECTQAALHHQSMAASGGCTDHEAKVHIDMCNTLNRAALKFIGKEDDRTKAARGVVEMKKKVEGLLKVY